MRSARYCFHCTDGRDAVFDLAGRVVHGEARVRACAAQVAQGLMQRGGPTVDWRDWIVDVHDAVGRRSLTLSFTDLWPERLPMR